MYLKELKAGSERDNSVPMFIAALFPIAKSWNQSKRPSADRMDKQNVVYTHDGILFIFKKKGHSDTCYIMGEPWELYAEWNKSVTKKQTLYESSYVRCLWSSDSYRQKLEWQFPEAAGRGEWGVVFNRDRVWVLQDEKRPGAWLHNSVNILNATKVYTWKWLR